MVLTKDILMKVCMTNPSFIRKYVLTDAQIDVVKGTRCGLGTSIALAAYKDISIQSASGRLQKLYKLGYLKRTAQPDPSGGIYYRYRPNY